MTDLDDARFSEVRRALSHHGSAESEPGTERSETIGSRGIMTDCEVPLAQSLGGAEQGPRAAGTRPEVAGGQRAAAISTGPVLLVDDEKTIVRIGRMALERAGFEVATARDGVEALAQLERLGDSVCALVLDVTLPRLGGAEILKRLDRERPHLPVLVASGLEAPWVEVGPASLRGRALLPKPYRPSELVAGVRALLERHGRSRASC